MNLVIPKEDSGILHLRVKPTPMAVVEAVEGTYMTRKKDEQRTRKTYEKEEEGVEAEAEEEAKNHDSFDYWSSGTERRVLTVHKYEPPSKHLKR
jgi:hypothetical protein